MNASEFALTPETQEKAKKVMTYISDISKNEKETAAIFGILSMGVVIVLADKKEG